MDKVNDSKGGSGSMKFSMCASCQKKNEKFAGRQVYIRRTKWTDKEYVYELQRKGLSAIEISLLTTVTPRRIFQILSDYKKAK